VKDGSIAVHKNHGGRKIKKAGGQSQNIIGDKIRLTDKQAIDVEMKASGRDDDQSVQSCREDKTT